MANEQTAPIPRERKPRITRDESEFRHLIAGQGAWLIIFPDCLWWAYDCKYVRESVAAWYRDGMRGLSRLHAERYGNNLDWRNE